MRWGPCAEAGDTHLAGLKFYRASLELQKQRLLKALHETGVKSSEKESRAPGLPNVPLASTVRVPRRVSLLLDEKGHSFHLTDRGGVHVPVG